MKLKFFLMMFCISAAVFSQGNKAEKNLMKDKDDKNKIELSLDIVSRYLWRGQCWGGDYVAVQPVVAYAFTKKLKLGIWATTNFNNEYYYPDGVTFYKGYREIDLTLSYKIFPFLQFQLSDYYWPSVSKVDDVDNNYFNYGTHGVKTVDAALCSDYRKEDDATGEYLYKYPFFATISTLVAGNDYRYDINNKNPKQNFTTYIETGYSFKLFKYLKIKELDDIKFVPVVGAVLNNKAQYYLYADYDKVSFCNIGMKIIKEFDLGNDIFLPISINYTYNGAINNTETFGRNFLILGISLDYETGSP